MTQARHLSPPLVTNSICASSTHPLQVPTPQRTIPLCSTHREEEAMAQLPIVTSKCFTAFLSARLNEGFYEGVVDVIRTNPKDSLRFACYPLRDTPAQAIRDARWYAKELVTMWPPDWK